MITLREAAQQALEALESLFTLQVDYARPKQCGDAITALRAALEQANFPEEKLQAVAEYVGDKYAVWYAIGARDVEEVLRQSERLGLVTLNFDTGEQPEQAPVAWMYVGLTFNNDMHGPHLVWKPEYMDAMSAEKGVKAVPLYAALKERNA